MRWPTVVAVLLLAGGLAGCSSPDDSLALRVEAYDTFTSIDRSDDAGFRLEITCDGGPVHVLRVSLAGFPDADLARTMWRLGWSDGSTTVAVYAEESPKADGRQASLYACSTTSPRITAVTLNDGDGLLVAHGDVEVTPTSG